MEFKRITFIVASPFNEGQISKFGLKYLHDYGFKVKVLDFSLFLQPAISNKYLPPFLNLYSQLKIVKSEREAFEEIVCLTPEDIVFALLPFNFATRRVYKRLSRQNVFLGTLYLDFLPAPLKTIKLFFRKPIRGLYRFACLMPCVWFRVKPFNFILRGGNNTISGNPLLNSNTRIIDAPAWDYEKYIKTKRTNDEDKNNLIVFLDQFLPFHLDFLLKKTKTPMSSKIYYSEMISFFKMVEDHFGCEVTIAAHPSSNYEKQPNIFGGRKIIKGATCELIRDSKFVISHASTSVNFAALYRKPVIFLSPDIEEKTNIGPLVNSIASAFNKKPIALGGLYAIDWQREIKVDETAYLKYIEKYIKEPGSPEKSGWDIFVDFIEPKTKKHLNQFN